MHACKLYRCPACTAQILPRSPHLVRINPSCMSPTTACASSCPCSLVADTDAVTAAASTAPSWVPPTTPLVAVLREPPEMVAWCPVDPYPLAQKRLPSAPATELPRLPGFQASDTAAAHAQFPRFFDPTLPKPLVAEVRGCVRVRAFACMCGWVGVRACTCMCGWVGVRVRAWMCVCMRAGQVSRGWGEAAAVAPSPGAL